VLHFEIGTVNNILDSFRGFFEDQVEVISEEEMTAKIQFLLQMSATLVQKRF
jgi:hypothetical protein